MGVQPIAGLGRSTTRALQLTSPALRPSLRGGQQSQPLRRRARMLGGMPASEPYRWPGPAPGDLGREHSSLSLAFVSETTVTYQGFPIPPSPPPLPHSSPPTPSLPAQPYNDSTPPSPRQPRLEWEINNISSHAPTFRQDGPTDPCWGQEAVR